MNEDEDRKARRREYIKNYRANMSEEQRERERKMKREYDRQRYANMTKEEWESRKAYMRNYMKRPEVRNRIRIKTKERYNSDPEFKEKSRMRMRKYQSKIRNDPVAIIINSRKEYDQLCENDPEEAKRLLADMEGEEGKDFRELMLNGIPEKKGIIGIKDNEE